MPLASQVARPLLLASLLAACSTAYADQPAARIALGVAPPRVRALYDVQILRESGEMLPTYQLHGRYYVQGDAEERYIIRISNPTPRRVEAVVSVDGLDVVDGENGDLRKRGYVVPPYGETRIEGFRTSQADVATFRFSSVAGSYAGLKGKARNVGVIAVALFEERALEPEPIIIGGVAPQAPYRGDGRRYEHAPATADAAPPAHARAEAKAAEPPPAPASAPSQRQGQGQGTLGAAAGRSAPADVSNPYGDEGGAATRQPDWNRERLGLGTEFGEQRYSAAQYTRFVRAAGRPVAIAELRYNDAAGLLALGVPVAPLPDRSEIYTREAADPFPGDHFARPPR
jgi:hypothetical protein